MLASRDGHMPCFAARREISVRSSCPRRVLVVGPNDERVLQPMDRPRVCHAPRRSGKLSTVSYDSRKLDQEEDEGEYGVTIYKDGPLVLVSTDLVPGERSSLQGDPQLASHTRLPPLFFHKRTRFFNLLTCTYIHLPYGAITRTKVGKGVKPQGPRSTPTTPNYFNHSNLQHDGSRSERNATKSPQSRPRFPQRVGRPFTTHETRPSHPSPPSLTPPRFLSCGKRLSGFVVTGELLLALERPPQRHRNGTTPSLGHQLNMYRAISASWRVINPTQICSAAEGRLRGASGLGCLLLLDTDMLHARALLISYPAYTVLMLIYPVSSSFLIVTQRLSLGMDIEWDGLG